MKCYECEYIDLFPPSAPALWDSKVWAYCIKKNRPVNINNSACDEFEPEKGEIARSYQTSWQTIF
jgi:hypothetical protein